jgi:hypothetical protein
LKIGNNIPGDRYFEETKRLGGKIINSISNVLLAEQVHYWITKKPSEAN